MDTINRISTEGFFASYSSDPAAIGFTDFLFDRNVTLKDNDFSNAHTATIGILSAIQTQDEELFHNVYNEISRRMPLVDAPWLLNDPLFYGLVIGAVTFNGDYHWIEETLLFRIENTKGELHEISKTLFDILSENWGSNVNLRPMILMARHHLKGNIVNSDLPQEVYRFLTENRFPYCKSDFLNALFLRAFDIAILSLAPEDPDRRKGITRLTGSLWTKALITGWAIWLITLSFCIVCFVIGVFWLNNLASESTTKDWVETLSLVGVPVIIFLPIWPLISKRKKIVNAIKRFIGCYFFGLNVDLFPPP